MKKPLIEDLQCDGGGKGYYESQNVKQAIEKAYMELIKYQNHKIHLAKTGTSSYDDLNKEEREIHINCCIDTKMQIRDLFDKEFGFDFAILGNYDKGEVSA